MPRAARTATSVGSDRPRSSTLSWVVQLAASDDDASATDAAPAPAAAPAPRKLTRIRRDPAADNAPVPPAEGDAAER